MPEIIPCPYLDALSPAELVKRFTYLSEQDAQTVLNPIWLNNNGQNVIGLLPTWAVTYRFDVAKRQFVTQQVDRTAMDFLQPTYRYQHFEHDFLEFQYHLTQYVNQQSSQNLTNGSGYNQGLMGFISYDLSAYQLAQATDSHYLSKNQPLAYFGHYDSYLTYQNGNWQLHATSQQAIENMGAIQHWLAKTLTIESLKSPKSLSLQPLWQPSDYRQAFERVQNYLTSGDCYQINLTQCWQGKTGQNLVDYLPCLHQATNAPFAGYLNVQNLGLPDYELLSCSPELFFTFAKNAQNEHTIITKPIKGTLPRGATVEEDLANKTALANSEKDKAENLMIVDLLRNDLGKYAKTGSVNVPNLFAIESFSNVHHMVSTITATLKDDVHPLTVLFDSLPAGSITGCPKKRAVEIIHELEVRSRGAYCGTMGYLNFDGTGQWNVLIRTLQAVGDSVTLWAGGGVTIASRCDAEYQECFDKVGNLLKVLGKNH